MTKLELRKLFVGAMEDCGYVELWPDDGDENGRMILDGDYDIDAIAAAFAKRLTES